MTTRPPNDRVYQAVIAVFRGLFRLLGLRFDVRGTEHLPAAGPAVIACNHIGYLDFTFVGLAASHRGRLVRFLAKRSTFDNPVSGPAMRAMGHIPVDRTNGAPAYRRAIRAVRAGELVGIFPEATISRAWTLKPFRPGAVALAIREQVPLVPMVTWGGHRVVTVGGRVGLRRGKPVLILVGEPLHPHRGDDRATVEKELRSRIQALLDTAQATYPARPRHRKDHWWLPHHLGGSAPTPDEAAALDAAAVAKADARAARREQRARR